MGRPFVYALRRKLATSHFRRDWRVRAGLASALAGIGAGPAFACTLCPSAQAISIRARLFGPDLWANLAAVSLPLLLLLAIIARIAREPRGPEGSS
jgi:hypothetical protein